MKRLDDKMGLKLAILIFITPIFISLALRSPYKILPVGDSNGWLGFFGSYFGGLLGFYAAYTIANKEFMITKHQIKRDKEEKNEERLLQQYPYLYSLKIDIFEIRTSLTSLLKDIEEKNIDKIITNIEKIHFDYEKYYQNIKVTSINILLIKLNKASSIIYEHYQETVNSYDRVKDIINLYSDKIGIENLISKDAIYKIFMNLIISSKKEEGKEVKIEEIEKEVEEKMMNIFSSYKVTLKDILDLYDKTILEIDKELEKAEIIEKRREA